jgi:TetR/AcrR family transcriptional regulator
VHNKRQTRTLPPEERRQQILQAVLEVVGTLGLTEATTRRVAERAGVSQGTLYWHFASRDEMFSAALQLIFQSQIEVADVPTEGNALDRLTEIALRHSRIMTGERGGFAAAWLEFIVAGPQLGFRDIIAESQRSRHKAVRQLIEEGQREGSIGSGVDADELAWAFLSVFWADNMATLMGVTEFVEEDLTRRFVRLIMSGANVSDRLRPQAGSALIRETA